MIKRHVKGKKVVKYLAWNTGWNIREKINIKPKERIKGSAIFDMKNKSSFISLYLSKNRQLKSRTAGIIKPTVFSTCLKERFICDIWFPSINSIENIYKKTTGKHRHIDRTILLDKSFMKKNRLNSTEQTKSPEKGCKDANIIPVSIIK